MCGALQCNWKLVCQKWRKSIHENPIYASFSYKNAPKHARRIDPSRFERVEQPCELKTTETKLHLLAFGAFLLRHIFNNKIKYLFGLFSCLYNFLTSMKKLKLNILRGYKRSKLYTKINTHLQPYSAIHIYAMDRMWPSNSGISEWSFVGFF